MNEMNELEIQLRSWAPRPPAAKLSQKLFARAAAAAEVETRERESASFSFRWLVPATAALLMVCIVFNQHNSAALAGTGGSGRMVAMIMSNQSAAAYLPGSFQREQNILPADTFEWTNGSRSTSSISSLSSSKGSN